MHRAVGEISNRLLHPLNLDPPDMCMILTDACKTLFENVIFDGSSWARFCFLYVHRCHRHRLSLKANSFSPKVKKASIAPSPLSFAMTDPYKSTKGWLN